MRLFRADKLPGQHHAHRHAIGHAAHQSMDAGAIGHQPPTHFRQTKLRIVRGQHDVAAQYQFETTADGIAVDRRQ